MKRIKVHIDVALEISVDEPWQVDQVIEELDYTFSSQTEGCPILSTEITEKISEKEIQE